MASRRIPSRGSPWAIAIIVGLTLVAAANVVFVAVAVSGADHVVPSYNIEPR